MRHLKDEFDHLSFKEVIMYSMTMACFMAATISIFLSIYIEPRGEIHASVLTYFGISMGFCGSVLGISAHYSSSLEKFKAEVMTMMQNSPQSLTAPTLSVKP